MTKNEMRILQVAAANLTDIMDQVAGLDQIYDDDVLKEAYRSANNLWLVMHKRMEELKK